MSTTSPARKTDLPLDERLADERLARVLDWDAIPLPKVAPSSTSARQARPKLSDAELRKRATDRQRARRRARGIMPRRKPEHGERGCYAAGCRLPECIAANTAAVREARARRKVQK